MVGFASKEEKTLLTGPASLEIPRLAAIWNTFFRRADGGAGEENKHTTRCVLDDIHKELMPRAYRFHLIAIRFTP